MSERLRHVPGGRAAVAVVAMLVTLTLLTSIETLPSLASSSRAVMTSIPHRCGAPPRQLDEPSGQLPLEPYTFKGWTRTYCTDFPGHRLPRGWQRFSGIPAGDPAGRWAPSHVSVHSGMLVISTWRDPAYQRRWTSGGVCQCGHPLRYGAIYVRTRLTGPGASGVELLWPKDGRWPPEVDFYESWQDANRNTYTDHFTAADHITQGWLNANLMKWHTWGVIWRPHELQFVVDWGTNEWEIWGTVTTPRAVPGIAMTLDIDQQTWCSILPACPTRSSDLLVDWVTEFRPNADL